METNKKEIMDTMMKRMKDKIKFKKYKMTSQRQIILRTFVESPIRHMSAEEVFELVKRRPPISVWRRSIGPLIYSLRWTSSKSSTSTTAAAVTN